MPRTIQRAAGPGLSEVANNCNCTALRKASRRVSQLYSDGQKTSLQEFLSFKRVFRLPWNSIGKSKPINVRPKSFCIIASSNIDCEENSFERKASLQSGSREVARYEQASAHPGSWRRDRGSGCAAARFVCC
jgi:hypothetical protein